MNIKKHSIIALICSLVTLSSTNTFTWFGSDNAGQNFGGGALTGAAIGGLAGGRKGAGYGALAGGLLGLASTQPRDRSDNYPANNNYARPSYNPNSRSSMRNYIADLETENQQLRNENYELMRELNTNRRR